MDFAGHPRLGYKVFVESTKSGLGFAPSDCGEVGQWCLICTSFCLRTIHLSPQFFGTHCAPLLTEVPVHPKFARGTTR